MITWMSEAEFNRNIDLPSFEARVKPICGTIADRSPPIFEIDYEEVHESQYLYRAFRWCGRTESVLFCLDVFENDLRRLKPLKFILLSSNDYQDFTWRRIELLGDFFLMLGKFKFTSIGSNYSEQRFSVIRDEFKDVADVIYRSDDEDDCLELIEFLKTRFGDKRLVLGTRIGNGETQGRTF